MSNREADALAIAGLSALWVALCLAINPAGDFPLNDDWSYGQIVRTFVEQGTLSCTGWLAISLVGHILWGALFCRPAGFSFDMLRLSGQVAGWLGVCALYVLLRQRGARRGTSLFGTLLLALNPLYFNLSQTFMSDVPSLTLTLLSLAGFLRALENDRLAPALWGTLAAAVAAWFRQTALLIPAAFLLATLTLPNRRRWIAPAFACCTAVVLSLAACDAWLLQRDHSAILYHFREKELLGSLLEPLRTLPLAVRRVGNILTYLGLFLMPLAVFLPNAPVVRAPNRRALAAALAVLGLSAAAAVVSLPLPFQGNIVNVWGLGAPTLHDIGIHEQGPIVLFPYAARVLLTVLSVASISFVAYRVWSGFPMDAGARAGAIMLLAFSLGLTLTLASIEWLDRHALPLVACLIILLVASIPRASTPVAAARLSAAVLALAALGALSVAGTQDYLAWNRARWQALDELISAGVSPDRIDGGFEFNGSHHYDPAYAPDPKTDPSRRSWWWVQRDDVVVTLGPLDGYVAWRTVPYPSWLHRNGRVCVLRKETYDDAR